MKIRSLFVESFGKLKNQRIDFSTGINVITGENESGKSSLARFIRFMLYGFTSPRNSSVAQNDKKKYTPWDESICKGEMSVSTENGTDYTLRREQAQRAFFSAADQNGQPAFSGICAGEAILGVNSDTFDKTSFIGSSDLFFDDASTLSSAIKNMVFSADSSIDSDAALKKIENLKKSILGKTAKSGELYETRLELAKLIERQEKLRSAHRELISAKASLDKVRQRLNENNASLDKLQKESDNIEAYNALCLWKKIEDAQQRSRLSTENYEKKCAQMTFSSFLPDRDYLAEMNKALINISALDAACSNAQKEFDAASQGLESCYTNKRQMIFNNLLHSTSKTASEVKKDITSLKRRLSSLNKAIFACLFLCVPIFVLTLSACLSGKFPWYSVLLSIIPAFGAVIFAVKGSKIKKNLEKLYCSFECSDLSEMEYFLENYDVFSSSSAAAKSRCDAASVALERARDAKADAASVLCSMLDKTGFQISYSDTSELQKIASEHIRELSVSISCLEDLSRAASKDAAVLDALVQSAGDLDKLKRKAETYDSSIPMREAQKVEREIAFYTEANKGLRLQERDFERKADVIAGNMEKPDELASNINILSEKIFELEKKHAALQMASEAIEKAHESMRGNVSPILTKEASEMFSKMTGGKYESLSVDNDLSLSFLQRGDAEFRNTDYLSSGALDAAYLCLRITLDKYLYNEPPVLIFDDAFIRLDEKRLSSVCEMLEELSTKYQVIVLSCQNREAEMLAGYGAKIISL